METSTPEQLIQRGIAPVKKAYLRPYAPRKHVEAVTGTTDAAEASNTASAAVGNGDAHAATAVKKKSRRQAQKVRHRPQQPCI